MHQLFSEPLSSQTAMQLCHFDVRDEDVCDTQLVTTRPSHRDTNTSRRHAHDRRAKRERDGDDAGEGALSSLCLRDVWPVLAYGDQASAPSRVLARAHRYDAQTPHATTTTASAAQLPHDDDVIVVDAHTPHVCRAMLRQALALIARVVALDTDGCFVSSSNAATAAASHDNDDNSNGGGKTARQSATTTAATATSHHDKGNVATDADKDVVEERTLMYLYCLVQSLELRLDDWCRQQGATTTTTATSSGGTCSDTDVWTTQLTALARRVYACVDALEQTVLSIVLGGAAPTDTTQQHADGDTDTHTTATTETMSGNNSNNSNNNSDTVTLTPPPSLSYVGELLAALPGAFAAVAWPCRVLPRTRPDNNNNDHRNKDDNDDKDKAMCVRVGAATTSIVLRALLEVQEADCCDVLERAHTATLTQLAAARIARRAGNDDSSEDKDGTHVAAREVVALTTMTFTDLLAKAWLGAYAQHGLQSAMFDMRALFYRLHRQEDEHSVTATETTTTTTTRKSAASRATGGGSSRARNARGAATQSRQQQQQAQQQLQPVRRTRTTAERRARLHELWTVWCTSLRTHARAFASRHGRVDDRCLDKATTYADEACSVFALLQPPAAPPALSLLPQPSATMTTRSRDVRACALRVLAHLRRVDRHGWFAVPAFDLVNIDFGSVALWVRSDAFARKSSRGAFDALRYALERMVDSCVVRYGPTHAFSVAITQVRQELVAAARREGLLV